MITAFNSAGPAFAMAEIYATRKTKVKLYREKGQWFIKI